MARSIHDDVFDAASDHIINNSNKLVVCETAPVSFAEANLAKGSGGKKLGEYNVVGGDFTKANGDVSGRKLTCGAQTGNNVDVSGDADHFALIDTDNSELLSVTPCATQTLTAGNPFNTQAFDVVEFRDPTA